MMREGAQDPEVRPMATDPRKRQKKLERRVAKRKEKKQLVIREQHVSIAERFTAAASAPVVDCRISDSLQDNGMGWVMLSRELPGGRVAVAIFLVDRYCLGVKDAFGEVLSRPEYTNKYLHKMASEAPSHSVPPADARRLLEDAVAYARRLGLHPHPDYFKAILLFGSIDPAQGSARYEFGKDGQPFFVAGPNDTPERCRQILGILNDTCGPGRFHYLLPLTGPDIERDLPGSPHLLGPYEE
jgi:hypothetical protein